jgi:hypothetical protein
MYSGSTLKHMQRFDAWFGAHQKMDRTARRHLELLVPQCSFPTREQILKFEGIDGPDGIKRKTDHYNELVKALSTKNQNRAAFEAAWISHAIVDGLTPAHHYPYEKELIKLRGGAGIETRTTPKEKLIMPGETLSKQMNNNWKMWGDKGLLATHFAFEWGVAAMIVPLRLDRAYPEASQIDLVLKEGVTELFKNRAKQIADLSMYEQFYKSGWTPRLAKQVRRYLVPNIVNTVTLVWYAALHEAVNT